MRDAGSQLERLPRLLMDRREQLVDAAIEAAKTHGYAPFTTTIRAAWIEAVDTLTESILHYLDTGADPSLAPRADVDYGSDPNFTVMRQVALRHRSLGITLQMYIGLFKHFRSIYIELLSELGPAGDAAGSEAAAERLMAFFDTCEMSIMASWSGAAEDKRLSELPARTRMLTLDKDRYFAVFESLRNPAFLLDRNHRLANANQAAAELFVGDADAGEIVYLTSMRGRKTSLEEVLQKASLADDGTDRTVWLDTRRGPLCFDVREREIHDALGNTKLGSVVILHDVTSHRRATEEAERARRAMSAFLATMSHEIRTPLHGVLGATELLRAAKDTHHQSYVDAIDAAGRHLLQTLNKVLDYSRLESGASEPVLKSCRLEQVFRDYETFASIGARRANVPLSMSVARNLPRYALIDWDMTQQVLTNLVSNAIRHDGGQGVSIAVRRRNGRLGRPLLRFEVSDHGPGIADGDAALLFEPFCAGKPGSPGGAGLGLAIARRLVEAMGGAIGFRNWRAAGALFWFEIPYHRTATPPGDDQPGAMQRPPGGMQAQRLRCLLVDDDPIGRMVTAEQLRRHGMAVTEAETGAMALDQSQGGCFDVFVIDHYLPDMEGAELAPRLRETNDRLACRPAFMIALTANADAVAPDGRGGFDAYLLKPATAEDILAAMAALPPARQSRSQAHQAMTVRATLSGVGPRVVETMVATFNDVWASEMVHLQDALQSADTEQIAEVAHRLASSCAVMGLTDLSDLLRDLETECRHGTAEPNIPAWQRRLAIHFGSAPDRARAIAETAVR